MDILRAYYTYYSILEIQNGGQNNAAKNGKDQKIAMKVGA